MNQTKEHFRLLDGLRGVAAALVLIGHASAIHFGPENSWIPCKSLRVIFFFELSGFVISSAYQRRMTSGMDFRDFMQRRGIRLFPMIVLAAILATLIAASLEPGYWLQGKGPIASMLSALCLPGIWLPFATFTRFPINPPQWSLFFELLAYGLFALVLYRLSTRRLSTVVAVLFAGFAVVETVPTDWPLFMNGFEAFGAFGAGMLVWRVFAARRSLVGAVPFWLLGAMIIGACLVPAAWGVWPDLLAFTILFPVVLLTGAAGGRAKPSATIRMLGDLSYPVYIIHWPLLQLARTLVQPAFGPLVSLLVGSATAIAVAWVALKAYDEPLRAWLVSRFVRRRVPTSDVRVPLITCASATPSSADHELNRS